MTQKDPAADILNSTKHANMRLPIAQWLLERNLSWIAAAEVKLAVVVAIDTAMLGVLGSALGAARADNRTYFALISSLCAILVLGLGLIFAATALFPRTSGPPSSLIFFGKIALFKNDEYYKKFVDVSQLDLLKDLLDQVHRNAEIATIKFKWIRKAMISSFLSILPWILALALLLRK